MSDEIKKILENYEKRLKIIENHLFSKGGKKSEKISGKKYEGLSGGFSLLIDNDFFNDPKSVNEIFNELKREGYHYPKKSIDKLLRVNFMKNKKILNRVKEDNLWKYVIRK